MTVKGRGRAFPASRRTLWIALAAGAAALCAVWLAGFGKIAPGLVGETPSVLSNQPIAVVSEQTAPSIYNLTGTVQSVTPVDAASRVAARVIAVPVHAGERVRRGVVLVQLDSTDLKARVAQAAGGLEAARAELARSEADYRRFAALLKRGSVTAHEYDGAAAAYHAALGNAGRATAAVEAARGALAYATVRAPADGVVVERLVEPGDMALPGKPLVRLYDERALRVEVEAPENLARRIAAGAPLKVTIGGGPAFSTRVNEIVPVADPGTRSFRLRASIPSGAGLKPGMFVRAELACGAEKILTVPQSATRIVGQLATVRVLARGAVQLRQVALGRKFNDRVEVLSGLKAGDRVIDARSNMARDGGR